MGLLNEIQEEAISRNSDVGSLLRKCLLLASRVDIKLLEDWVKYELNGYPTEVQVPDYRNLELAIKANFLGSFGREMRNVPIPSAVIETIVGNDQYNRFLCKQPITTIVDTEKARNGSVQTVNLNNLILLLGENVYEGFNAAQVWGETPSMSVIGIIEAVKTRVLEFTLKLEERYPNAREVDSMNKKDLHLRNDVKEIVSNTIYGNVGFVGNANHSTVNVAINSGDIEMLKEYLKQQGVGQADLTELEAAIQLEPEIENDKKFGPQVATWITKMVGKAASGAWEVGVGASSSILATALLRYYGFN